MAIQLLLRSAKWGCQYTSLYLLLYHYLSKKVENRNDIASAVIATLHHTIVTIKTIPYLKVYYDRCVKSLTDSTYTAFKFDDHIVKKIEDDSANSIGYLLADMIPSVIHAKKFDYGLILHHIHYPIFCFFVQKRGYINYTIAAHIFEFSAIFNNLRVITKFLKLTPKISNILNVAFAFAFLLTRLPISWIETLILILRRSQLETFESKIVCAYMMFFTMIFNHYYAALIIKKALTLRK
jgi:hypothetical protein